MTPPDNCRLIQTERDFQGYMPYSFLLYRPKKHQSGDFYWFKQGSKDSFYFAVSDFTKSGGRKELIRSEVEALFHEAMKNSEQYCPNKTVKKVRKQIFNYLYVKDKQNLDSIDTTLIHFDRHNRLLHFVGDHNPIYILRKGHSPLSTPKGLLIKHEQEKFNVKLYRINGDENQLLYSTNTQVKVKKLQLRPGDEIFLASDGYTHQFGGKNNLNFNENSLQELLLMIHGRSCEEQKVVLNDIIINWQGSNEQTDDICVAGMKIN